MNTFNINVDYPEFTDAAVIVLTDLLLAAAFALTTPGRNLGGDWQKKTPDCLRIRIVNTVNPYSIPPDLCSAATKYDSRWWFRSNATPDTPDTWCLAIIPVQFFVINNKVRFEIGKHSF